MPMGPSQPQIGAVAIVNQSSEVIWSEVKTCGRMFFWGDFNRFFFFCIVYTFVDGFSTDF